jgi:hypothetical protein
MEKEKVGAGKHPAPSLILILFPYEPHDRLLDGNSS